MNKKILIIFFAALAVRTGFLAFTPSRPITWDDALSWDAVAMSLITQGQFIDSDGKPTQARPPVYPIVLSIIYRIFGHHYIAAKVFNAVADSLTLVLAFLIGKKMFDEKIALYAALALCVYPPLVVYSGVIGTEILYTLIISVFVYTLILAFGRNNPRLYVASGIILGIATLCRSTCILYPFFLLGFLFVLKRLKKIQINPVPVFLRIFVPMVIMISPWTIRNYIVFNDFIPVNTGSGGLFWSATFEEWDGRALRDLSPADVYPELKNMPWHKWEKVAVFYGLKNIAKHPVSYAKLCAKNFLRLWFKPIGQELVAVKKPAMGKLLYLLHFVWVGFAVSGFVRLRNKLNTALFPVYVLVIYLGVMHTIIAPIPRYRLFVEPYLMLFAVSAVLFLVTKKDENIISQPAA